MPISRVPLFGSEKMIALAGDYVRRRDVAFPRGRGLSRECNGAEEWSLSYARVPRKVTELQQ